MVKRLGRPIPWILRSAISFSTNLYVWHDLGYYDVPSLSGSKMPFVPTYRMYRQIFFLRELYCLFVGSAISACAGRPFLKSSTECNLDNCVDTAVELLPRYLRRYFKIVGLDPSREQIDYYKMRIRAYANCKGDEIHKCLCNKYAAELESYDYSFVTGVALVVCRFHTWYTEGSSAMLE